MGVTCEVFIDRSLTPSRFEFLQPPRVGDEVRIKGYDDSKTYRVDRVVHDARGSLDHPGATIELHVSERRGA